MHKVLFMAAGAIFVSLQPAFAQESAAKSQPALPEATSPVVPESPPALTNIFAGDCATSKCRIWASADYLLWWVKDAPSNFPLVTTTNSVAVLPNGVPPGALGRPDTQAVFGGTNFNYGAFSGSRLTMGTWIDADNTVGVEASGFFLAQQSLNFLAKSGPNGSPQYYMPYFNTAAGREGSFTISEPASGIGVVGAINFATTLQLWGAEANSVFNAWRTPTSGMDFLVGFRFVNLQESISASGNQSYLLPPTQNDQVSMSFNTLNEFYGAQFGARGYWNFGRLSTEVTAKIALGATYQSVKINGSDTVSNSPLAGTVPGFVYAQPTNIGNESRFGFSVIPQINLKVGYNITSNLRATLGYDFLYWSNVVRPGDQIDRNINVTPLTVGSLIGPATPSRLMQSTDFFANGLSFGLELKY